MQELFCFNYTHITYELSPATTAPIGKTPRMRKGRMRRTTWALYDRGSGKKAFEI